MFTSSFVISFLSAAGFASFGCMAVSASALLSTSVVSPGRVGGCRLAHFTYRIMSIQYQFVLRRRQLLRLRQRRQLWSQLGLSWRSWGAESRLCLAELRRLRRLSLIIR